jgi:DNA-binding phage protein
VVENFAPTLFANFNQFLKGQALSNLDVLQKAFATNNLRTICKAIDDEMLRHSSITEVCELAKVNRTTLFRAFRRRQGAGLDTIITVLGALGFRLAVTASEHRKTRADASTSDRNILEKTCSGEGVARKLTEALNSSDVRPVIKAFAEILQAQDNIARLSKKTIRCRETFYRAFVYPRVPRFSTALTLLNALEFTFMVRRASRCKLSTRSPRGQLATATGSQTEVKNRPLSIER